MITKTSIRFFNNNRVRARWEDESASWWYAATDVVNALLDSANPRRYWNTFKSRHNELSSFCRQLKMTAMDGKQYHTDCLNQDGINLLLVLLPVKDKSSFAAWLRGRNDPLDEQSKKKAYELYANSILEDSEVGTIKGLQQILGYLFEGLYDFAGRLRDKNISKGGFTFANSFNSGIRFLGQSLKALSSIPTVGDIDDVCRVG